MLSLEPECLSPNKGLYKGRNRGGVASAFYCVPRKAPRLGSGSETSQGKEGTTPIESGEGEGEYRSKVHLSGGGLQPATVLAVAQGVRPQP